MGYILLIIFILTWLNVRKIRKAVDYLAKQEGYTKLSGQILDVIADYQSERKTQKKEKKEQKLQEKYKREPEEGPE